MIISSRYVQVFGAVILGLGVWTLSQKWYYLYLIQHRLYQVTSHV